MNDRDERRFAYECQLCQDVRSIVTRRDESGRLYGRKCSCVDAGTVQARISDLLRDWGTYDTAQFGTFVPADEQQRRVVEVMNKRPQKSYLITGGVGVGKTHLLFSQARKRIEESGPEYWLGTEHQLASLLRKVRAGKADMPWRAQAHYHFFLDDLGTVGGQDGYYLPHLGDLLNDIINRDRWALTITMNLDVDRLAQEYGARIARRVLDKCKLAELGNVCGLKA